MIVNTIFFKKKMKKTNFELFKNREKYSSGVSQQDLKIVSQFEQLTNVPICQCKIDQIEQGISVENLQIHLILKQRD